MSNQTQDYISLKPIAERFKEVAASISNDEIKSLIKEELREQIRNQVNFGSIISELVETELEKNDKWKDLVLNCMEESIRNKFR